MIDHYELNSRHLNSNILNKQSTFFRTSYYILLLNAITKWVLLLTLNDINVSQTVAAFEVNFPVI